ncbi:MAG TPA: LysR family transcriptional regulator substrate-binding protein [Mycobacterium sp.]|nr:LysR family transcriptional regulator substrate-binding protein [Mycobacterium sp.]HUH70175.1 LysR family transcriptional regulator substrate-binding protein [Mycobacterium sp.]
MTAAGSSYKGFRFPPEIISHCVWLYHRFPLSFRDVQELMLERGVDSNEVDMALVPLPVPGRCTTSVVADEEIVLAAPSGHPLARQPSVRIQDLEGARIVHFSPENGLSGWLDRSLAAAGIHTETVMRTAVTSAAPQLAAAGLGVAVCPVSAVSAGFPGAVRSFSPRWVRQLGAVTPATPDPLTAQFIGDLRTRGVHVSSDVRAQLTDADSPA